MFGKLFASRNVEPNADEGQDLKVAVAALLVEAARADEEYADEERAVIDRYLQQAFALTPAQSTELRVDGETAQNDANDLHRFTRLVKTLPEAEKMAFVEGLWEIILSDQERDPFEDALMRRLCGLIHIEDQQNGAARARVIKRLSNR